MERSKKGAVQAYFPLSEKIIFGEIIFLLRHLQNYTERDSKIGFGKAGA
jgi:hypothetical protein